MRDPIRPAAPLIANARDNSEAFRRSALRARYGATPTRVDVSMYDPLCAPVPCVDTLVPPYSIYRPTCLPYPASPVDIAVSGHTELRAEYPNREACAPP